MAFRDVGIVGKTGSWITSANASARGTATTIQLPTPYVCSNENRVMPSTEL